MLIRFWGTRGSLPVALTTRALQAKLVRAIMAASGKRLDTEEKARKFVEKELDFVVSHTFGGHSPCVQIDSGGGHHLRPVPGRGEPRDGEAPYWRCVLIAGRGR